VRAKGDFAEQRARMVARQLRRRGIADERVLEAMAAVPRELFVPEEERARAYDDGALPIGHEQTISQPWIVAAICAALELTGSELVLEVGAGSGYSTCVLALLAEEVVALERVGALAVRARERIRELGVTNAEVLEGDGSAGLPERAPFNGIAVHATAPAPPPSLLSQLQVGGWLVAPIASDRADMLTAFRRLESEPGESATFERRVIGPCRFVPLIGREGFG
jgi:protein-L-isoaspartate(D-aspartate) O-methyltransferase